MPTSPSTCYSKHFTLKTKPWKYQPISDVCPTWLSPGPQGAGCSGGGAKPGSGTQVALSPAANTQLTGSFPTPRPSLVATPRPLPCQPLTTLTQTQARPVQAPDMKILGVCELRLIPTDPVVSGTLAGRRGSGRAGPRLSKTKPCVPILGPLGPEGTPGGSVVLGVVTISCPLTS